MVVGSFRRGLWRSSEGATMVSGGPERGSLEVFRGCMGSPGTVLRALVRVSGGPERGSLEVFRECMGSPGTVLRGLVRVVCARRGFMGSPKIRNSLIFATPMV